MSSMIWCGFKNKQKAHSKTGGGGGTGLWLSNLFCVDFLSQFPAHQDSSSL
ncbi:Uncharacterized protein DAT39_015139 [Clarias magur]|uniref:Uncharacterized protein n=1 Tax=Clarias magur TaxID=1594786 RepID=A0A8J4UH66_CLAMG|nr:Uncharacterized protein DAT39_015139 [Clarias magur]